MGVLSQICIWDYFDAPKTGNWSSIDDDLWYSHFANKSNWVVHEELGNLIICGNSTGAGKCPEKSICMAVSLSENVSVQPSFVLREVFGVNQTKLRR